MRRILVVLATVFIAGLLVTPAARAGAWEETLLDPPPARIEPGVTYTLGYWILQHGSYPFQGGDLGPTALIATEEKSREQVVFSGTESRAAGHYSAEAVFPHAGTWELSSKHQVIMTDPLVATVTVPGSVRIAPSEMRDRAPYEWGTVRPSFPPSAPDADAAAPGAPPANPAPPTSGARAVEPKVRATRNQPGTALPWGVIVLAGAMTIGLAVWLGRRHARANRELSPPAPSPATPPARSSDPAGRRS
jgi:hypothetical protein